MKKIVTKRDNDFVVKVLIAKKRLLKAIPTNYNSIQEEDLIISFEKILNNKKAYSFDGFDVFWDLKGFLYNTKDEDLNFIDKYFKKVHRVIRKRAKKSSLYQDCLESIMINNFKNNTSFYDKKDYEKAYDDLLDYYDPNKSSTNIFPKWEGFWSLISTNKGIVSSISLSDTMDREIFYEYIDKNTKKNK